VNLAHIVKHNLIRLSQQILPAQEDKQEKISRDLQDETAQTSLGINVRLVSLKKVNVVNTEGLKKEIASTQRVVDMSVKTIKRFAREFGNHHET